MVQVGLPVLVREEVVLPGLYLLPGGECRVYGEAWPGYEDVLPGVRHGGDGDVEGAGAARAEDHVVRRDFRPRHRDVLSHRLAGLNKARAGAVAVTLPLHEGLSDSLHHLRGGVEVPVHCGIAQRQRYLTLVGIGCHCHGFHHIPDWVECVFCDNRRIDFPFLPSARIFPIYTETIREAISLFHLPREFVDLKYC